MFDEDDAREELNELNVVKQSCFQHNLLLDLLHERGEIGELEEKGQEET